MYMQDGGWMDENIEFERSGGLLLLLVYGCSHRMNEIQDPVVQKKILIYPVNIAIYSFNNYAQAAYTE